MSTFEFSGAFNRSRTSSAICSASPMNMDCACCCRVPDGFVVFFFLFCLWDRVCVDWLDCGVDVADVCCFHGLAARTMTVMAMMAIAHQIAACFFDSGVDA